MSLPSLLRQGGSLELTVDQPLQGLDPDQPVRGWLRLRHHGTHLEVEGQASTRVRRCCDRCLGSFELPLQARAHELLELAQAPRDGLETAAADPGPGGPSAAAARLGPLDPARDLPPDGAFDAPEERLDPAGRFDPAHWLFEQLHLRLPLVNRCGSGCPGPARWTSEAPAHDPRWAALQALQPD